MTISGIITSSQPSNDQSKGRYVSSYRSKIVNFIFSKAITSSSVTEQHSAIFQRRPFLHQENPNDQDRAILWMIQNDYGLNDLQQSSQKLVGERNKATTILDLRNLIFHSKNGRRVSVLVEKKENENLMLVDNVSLDLEIVEVRDPSAQAPESFSAKDFIKIWDPSKPVVSFQPPHEYAKRQWDCGFQGWDYFKCAPKNVLRLSCENLLKIANNATSLTEGWNNVICRCSELSVDTTLETLHPTNRWEPEGKTDLQNLLDRQTTSNIDPNVLFLPWGDNWIVVLEANKNTVEYLDPHNEIQKIDRRDFEATWREGRTLCYEQENDFQRYYEARRLRLREYHCHLGNQEKNTILLMILYQKQKSLLFPPSAPSWDVGELKRRNIPFTVTKIQDQRDLDKINTTIKKNLGSFGLIHDRDKGWILLEESSKGHQLRDPFSSLIDENPTLNEGIGNASPVVLVYPKNEIIDLPHDHSSISLQKLAIKLAQEGTVNQILLENWENSSLPSKEQNAGCRSEELYPKNLQELEFSLHPKEKSPTCLLIEKENKWWVISDVFSKKKKAFAIDPKNRGEEIHLQLWDTDPLSFPLKVRRLTFREQ